jgi:transposase InsO family protein
VRFLEGLIAAAPYRLHTALSHNGIQTADLPRNRGGWTAHYRVHPFDQIYRATGIEHRLTKPNHPWTNGQVERMNRTIKEATVSRYTGISVHSQNSPCQCSRQRMDNTRLKLIVRASIKEIQDRNVAKPGRTYYKDDLREAVDDRRFQ